MGEKVRPLDGSIKAPKIEDRKVDLASKMGTMMRIVEQRPVLVHVVAELISTAISTLGVDWALGQLESHLLLRLSQDLTTVRSIYSVATDGTGVDVTAPAFASLATRLHLLCLVYPHLGQALGPQAELVNELVGLVEDAGKAKTAPKAVPLALLWLDAYNAESVLAGRRKAVEGREWRYLDSGPGADRYTWNKFVPAAVKTVEAAFRNGETSVSYTVRHPYTLDFSTFMQKNMETHASRPVMLMPKEEVGEEKPGAVSGLSEEARGRLLKACVALLGPEQEVGVVEAAMRLCLRLTREPNLAQEFVALEGLERLFDLPSTSAFPGAVPMLKLLSRHTLESETALRTAMERVIRAVISNPTSNPYDVRRTPSVPELHSSLRSLAPVAARDPELFQELIVSVMKAYIPSGSEANIRAAAENDYLQVKVETSPVQKAGASPQVSDLLVLILRVISRTFPSGKKGKEVGWLMTRSAGVRLAAELSRSFASFAIAFADSSLKPGPGSVVQEESPTLAFLFDHFLAGRYGEELSEEEVKERDEVGSDLEALVAVLASLNSAPEAQSSLVSELKAALLRAMALPESPEKQKRLTALLGLICVAKDSCPNISPSQAPIGPKSPAPGPTALQQNNILRLMHKRKLIQDIARVPLCMDISGPDAAATLNAMLKPLDDLTRAINSPSQQAAQTAGPGRDASGGETASAESRQRATVTSAVTASIPSAPAPPLPPPEGNVPDDGNQSDSSASSTPTDSSTEDDDEAEGADNVGNPQGAEDPEEDEDDDEDDEDHQMEPDTGEESGDGEDEDVEEGGLGPMGVAEAANELGSEHSDYEAMGVEETADDGSLQGDILIHEMEEADAAEEEMWDGLAEEIWDGDEMMTMGILEDALQHFGARIMPIVSGGGSGAVMERAAGGVVPGPGEVLPESHPLLSPVSSGGAAEPVGPGGAADGTGVGGVGGVIRQGAFRHRIRAHHAAAGFGRSQAFLDLGAGGGVGEGFRMSIRDLVETELAVAREGGPTSRHPALPLTTPSTLQRWSEEARLLDGLGLHLITFNIKKRLARQIRAELAEAAEKKKLEEDSQAKAKAEEEEKKKEEEEAEKKKESESEGPPPPIEAEQAPAAPVAEAPPAVHTPTEVAVDPIPDPVPAPAAPPAVDAELEARRVRHNEELESYRELLGDIDVPLGVSPAFLAALPPEMRREVIDDHLRQERIQSLEAGTAVAGAVGNGRAAAEGGERPAEINREFLDALPPELREEVLRQERANQLAAAGPSAQPADITSSELIESLPPNLRRQVLADMDDSQIPLLPENYRSEAQELRSQLDRRAAQLMSMHRHLPGGHIFGSLNGAAGGRHLRLRRGEVPARNPANLAALTTPPHKGLQLLDREALSGLLLLLLHQEPAINSQRLLRILKYLCYHPGTRDWLIRSQMSILQKVMETGDVCEDWALLPSEDGEAGGGSGSGEDIIVEEKQTASSWLSKVCLSDRTSVFQVGGVGKKARNARTAIAVNPKAKAKVVRQVLDSLLPLAKTFPAQFLPASLRQLETEKVKEGRSGGADLWSVLLRLDAGPVLPPPPPMHPPLTPVTPSGKSSGMKGIQRTTSLLSLHEEQGEKRLEDSPLGRLISILPDPLHSPSNGLLERLLKLISTLFQFLPDNSIQELGSLEPVMGKVVEVVTTSLGSWNTTAATSGMHEGTTLLMEAVRVFGSRTQTLLLHALVGHALSLGVELGGQIREVVIAMRNIPPSADETANPSAGIRGAASAARGLVTNRFGGDVVVVGRGREVGNRQPAPSTMVCPELQLPAIAALTAKSSTQSHLLRCLDTLLTLRKAVRNRYEAIKAKNKKEEEHANKGKEATAQEAKEPEGEPEKKEEEEAAKEEPQPKPKEAEEKMEAEEKREEMIPLTALLSELEGLWSVMSECLERLGKASDPHAVLILQSAAESFFLVHATDDPSLGGPETLAGQTQSPGPELDASLGPAGSLEQDAAHVPPDTLKLVRFAERHKRLMNDILRSSSASLADGPFAILKGYPRLLDFDVKRKYFRKELSRLERDSFRRRREDVALRLRRPSIFQDSFRELFRLSAEEWKSRFYIMFEGEEGQDAGGLLREWFNVVTREIFNPNYALFKIASGDGVTHMINPASYVNLEHLEYFKFVGRLIAKAIYENKFVNCYFTRAFYKHILQKPVKPADLESEDPVYYGNLKFLLDNNIADAMLDLNFTLEVEEYGERQTRELKEGGRDIPVTDDNKADYVNLVCQTKMTGSIKKQLDKFLAGFYDLIPKDLISIFNEQELELLISGLPEIDLDDLEANTEYNRYERTSPQILWFWRALRSFDTEDKAKFLQFVTGTSKVPLQGFASLEGMNGMQKFSIHRDERDTNRLPAAHTCFNQLDLPAYESYDSLRHSLLMAVQECSEGFGFA